MVKRSFLRSLWVLGALAAPFAGCSGKVIGVSGGETNWLASCASDASCDSGQRCLCGVCTKECTDSSACSGAICATQGTAVFASACADKPTLSGVCLASCASSSDCKGDLTCVDSACMRPPLRNLDGSAGTGGAPSAAGGTSGTPLSDSGVSTGGASSTGPLGDSSPASGCTLTVLFSPMYSGYDGVHTYQVPAVVAGVSNSSVTWTASDPSMVSIRPDIAIAQGGAMLTTLKAGTVTITATAGTLCGSSLLTITQFAPSDWESGNTRYNLSNPVPNPFPDGGLYISTLPDAGNPLDPANAPPGCVTCHGPTATSGGYRYVAFTPEQTGGFSDDQLIATFTKGEVPAGGAFDLEVVPPYVFSFIHKWNDISTPSQQRGMVAYLRALSPAPGNSTFDFGKGPSLPRE